MNIIPKKQPKSANYICTWGVQNKLVREFNLPNVAASGARDTLTEDYLFNHKYYHFMPDEYRSGLIFLLDDGWDVPYNSLQPSEAGPFGSLEPDSERWKSFGTTPKERLINISKKIKELGYQGLGLWVSPQLPFSEKEPDMVKARAHWEEKAKWCNEADVMYWKVDWGRHSKSVGYREMMTECVKKYAPNLIIEHAYGQDPFTSDKVTDETGKGMAEVCEYSDCFRTYDLAEQFEATDAYKRADVMLRNVDKTKFRHGVKCLVNIETPVSVAAGLGFNVGIMHYSRDMEALLRWQRISPAFGIAEADYISSAEKVTESKFFDVDPYFWLKVGGKLYSFDVPVAASRGTRLPDVKCDGEKPIILASENPNNGAYAVSAVRRTVEPNSGIIYLADVTIYPSSGENPIGVFGYFRTLTVAPEHSISKDSHIYIQGMLAEEATDITDSVTIADGKLIIDGMLLRKHGFADYERRGLTSPAAIIKIV